MTHFHWKEGVYKRANIQEHRDKQYTIRHGISGVKFSTTNADLGLQLFLRLIIRLYHHIQHRATPSSVAPYGKH